MSLYDELLRATDNLQDISFSRYGTITNITDELCSVKEEEQDITHQNVPILNKTTTKVGDKVIIGFVDNNLYNPIILGNLTRGNESDGGGGIIMVGSFKINEEGHLIATIPKDTVNPYHIDNNGHLIYNTEAI